MPDAGAFDVVVVGNGVAGLAVSIGLARTDHRVFLMSPMARSGNRIGECLSPAAAGVMRDLGIWDGFVADGHLPCYANRFAWGEPNLAVYDFINDPRGHAWHIDRLRFESRLAQQAAELGVLCAPLPRPVSVEGTGEGWRFDFGGQAEGVRARFVVDATGRASWFARRHGAISIAHDRQIALVAILSPGTAALDESTTLVESVELGWWYSAVTPDGRLVACFMTDPDILRRGEFVRAQRWHDLVGQTRHTRRRIAANGYSLGSDPWVASANTCRIDRFAGQNWLAVGDAALCFDPLSAHGLTVALASGRDGARAIAADRRGDARAIPAYCQQLDLTFNAYDARRLALYAAERRWPRSAYWRRRRDPVRARARA